MCVIHSKTILKVKSPKTNPNHDPKAFHANLVLTVKAKKAKGPFNICVG